MKRVLLVEDDRDVSDIIQNHFAKAGYAVESLTEGRSIVERRFERPDVFIFDNGLPVIDGIALCKYLKLQDDLSHIPVLIISGNYEVQLRATKAGAAMFLPKPFSLHQMLTIVARLTSSGKSRGTSGV